MTPNRLSWLVEPGSPSRELADLFEAAGYQFFLVGGSVRDAFLDRDHEDLDFATDALPPATRKIVSRWADEVYRVGEAFGTIKVHKRSLRAEITTFRSEIYRDESRKPTVTYSRTIEEDLSRRDFTINAIALRLPALETADPYGGLQDLAVGRLDTPLDPDISFSDDPLRMLRLFRFHATFGFEIVPRVWEAATRLSPRLEIISAERIRDELSKLIVAPAPSSALSGVVKTGLANWFLPELGALAMAQDPVHQHKDVLSHSLAVLDKTRPELTIRLAALLHDIGKPATREYGPEGVSFHHHEVVGQRMARDRLRALRYSKELVDDVGRLVFLHLRPHTLRMGWSDAAVRRYVRDAGDLLELLNELVRCDVTTANARKADDISRRIDELELRIEELGKQEELDSLRPPIDGHQVMERLGIKPGPLVGEIMELLYERRIEQGPYSVEEALTMVEDWYNERS
ncbi:MAG: CCA tRNA nucleotidyltransferase [Actinobacteria bacterium]|nr:CCA tRNA nucleotidyltransferase [Actinomycetota bacterium]